jgi:hypothetical protein
MTSVITQSTNPNLDLAHARDVIRAANRQVFGNAHLMEAAHDAAAIVIPPQHVELLGAAVNDHNQ